MDYGTMHIRSIKNVNGEETTRTNMHSSNVIQLVNTRKNKKQLDTVRIAYMRLYGNRWRELYFKHYVGVWDSESSSWYSVRTKK